MRLKRVIEYAIVLVVLLIVSIGLGLVAPLQALFLLPFGWLLFLRRVGSEVHVNLEALAAAALTLLVVAWLSHRVLSWFSTSLGHPNWRKSWTASLLTLLLSVFVTSIATTGLIHQIGWLVKRTEPLLQSSWETGRMGLVRQLSRGCRQLHTDLSQDPATAFVKLAASVDLSLLEHYALVPLPSDPETMSRVLFVPRNPGNGDHDLFECLPSGSIEKLPNEALAELLVAGEPPLPNTHPFNPAPPSLTPYPTDEGKPGRHDLHP